MSEERKRFQMTSYDELCGNTGKEEGDVKTLRLDLLDPFENHPFKVLDDEKMTELAESIKENGILTPIMVRAKPNGRYEIISGHRRCHAAGLVNLTSVPVVIKELSNDEATVLMVDANIQREEILPSERAKSLQMKMNALSRSRGEAIGGKSRDIVGEEAGMSGRQVQRYIGLNRLLPELLDMTDEKKIPFKEASAIASYEPKRQQEILDGLKEGFKLKDLLSPEKKKIEARKITITEDRLERFFPSYYTMGDMEKIIYELLERWKETLGGVVDDE